MCEKVLFSDFERFDDFFVLCRIFSFKIGEHFSSFCYHHHDPSSRMVVFFVLEEMFFEVFYFCGKYCYLYFSGTGIIFFLWKLLDDAFFIFFCNCHDWCIFIKVKGSEPENTLVNYEEEYIPKAFLSKFFVIFKIWM